MDTVEVLKKTVVVESGEKAVVEVVKRTVVEVIKKTVVVESVEKTVVVQAPGPQGIQGTTGPQGLPGSENYIDLVSGVTLGSGRFLHVLPGGAVVYADAATNRPAHGFTHAAVNIGETVRMYATGQLTGMSGLAPGSTYWLSGITPGLHTITPPAAGFIQAIGRAVAGDTLVVDINPLVLLV